MWLLFCSTEAKAQVRSLIDLGCTDTGMRLTRIDAEDGDTACTHIGGREVRTNLNPADDFYMYFDYDDFEAQYAFSLEVSFLYYDVRGLACRLEFDTHSNPYQPTPYFASTGTNTWRNAQFRIYGHEMRGRQNSGADFRFHCTPGASFYVDRIEIIVCSPLFEFCA